MKLVTLDEKTLVDLSLKLGEISGKLDSLLKQHTLTNERVDQIDERLSKVENDSKYRAGSMAVIMIIIGGAITTALGYMSHLLGFK